MGRGQGIPSFQFGQPYNTTHLLSRKPIQACCSLECQGSLPTTVYGKVQLADFIPCCSERNNRPLLVLLWIETAQAPYLLPCSDPGMAQAKGASWPGTPTKHPPAARPQLCSSHTPPPLCFLPAGAASKLWELYTKQTDGSSLPREGSQEPAGAKSEEGAWPGTSGNLHFGLGSNQFPTAI